MVVFSCHLWLRFSSNCGSQCLQNTLAGAWKWGSKVWSSVNCPTVKMVSVFRYCSSCCWFTTSYYHINFAYHSRHCFRPRPPTWFWSKTQILSFGVLHRERSMFLIAYQIHGPNSIKRDILFTFLRTFYRNLWALFFQISTTCRHSPPSLLATAAMSNRARAFFVQSCVPNRSLNHGGGFLWPPLSLATPPEGLKHILWKSYPLSLQQCDKFNWSGFNFKETHSFTKEL